MRLTLPEPNRDFSERLKRISKTDLEQTLWKHLTRLHRRQCARAVSNVVVLREDLGRQVRKVALVKELEMTFHFQDLLAVLLP